MCMVMLFGKRSAAALLSLSTCLMLHEGSARSASDRWLIRAAISRPGSCMISDMSDERSRPMRPIPVSIFTWTGRARPLRTASLENSRADFKSCMTGVSSISKKTGISERSKSTSIGAVIPLWRSSLASETKATARQLAPPLIKALDNSTAPWP